MLSVALSASLSLLMVPSTAWSQTGTMQEFICTSVEYLSKHFTLQLPKVTLKPGEQPPDPKFEIRTGREVVTSDDVTTTLTQIVPRRMDPSYKIKYRVTITLTADLSRGADPSEWLGAGLYLSAKSSARTRYECEVSEDHAYFGTWNRHWCDAYFAGYSRAGAKPDHARTLPGRTFKLDYTFEHLKVGEPIYLEAYTRAGTKMTITDADIKVTPTCSKD